MKMKCGLSIIVNSIMRESYGYVALQEAWTVTHILL